MSKKQKPIKMNDTDIVCVSGYKSSVKKQDGESVLTLETVTTAFPVPVTVTDVPVFTLMVKYGCYQMALAKARDIRAIFKEMPEDLMTEDEKAKSDYNTEFINLISEEQNKLFEGWEDSKVTEFKTAYAMSLPIHLWVRTFTNNWSGFKFPEYSIMVNGVSVVVKEDTARLVVNEIKKSGTSKYLGQLEQYFKTVASIGALPYVKTREDHLQAKDVCKFFESFGRTATRSNGIGGGSQKQMNATAFCREFYWFVLEKWYDVKISTDGKVKKVVPTAPTTNAMNFTL